MTFIIAEAGVNHCGRLDYALALVQQATAAGADAVKFQAFTPTVQAPLDWETRAMLKGLALTREELVMCAAEARREGIEFMCTPMDAEWLAFCVDVLGIRRVKVGSGQNRNIPFLREVGATRLPVILSAGMGASVDDMSDAWDYLMGTSRDVLDITFLSCVSKYPTPETEMSLEDMKDLRRIFPNAKVGLSSHCRSFWPCVAAAYAGASVVEVHVKLDEGHKGPDMSSSILPCELKAMVHEIRAI